MANSRYSLLQRMMVTNQKLTILQIVRNALFEQNHDHTLAPPLRFKALTLKKKGNFSFPIYSYVYEGTHLCSFIWAKLHSTQMSAMCKVQCHNSKAFLQGMHSIKYSQGTFIRLLLCEVKLFLHLTNWFYKLFPINKISCCQFI